jgi:hypothetical protein
MDITKRLLVAQTLNELLKTQDFIRFPKKTAEDVKNEISVYTNKLLNNLLLEVMGEQSYSQFSEEEVVILKATVAKIKQHKE